MFMLGNLRWHKILDHFQSVNITFRVKLCKSFTDIWKIAKNLTTISLVRFNRSRRLAIRWSFQYSSKFPDLVTRTHWNWDFAMIKCLAECTVLWTFVTRQSSQWTCLTTITVNVCTSDVWTGRLVCPWMSIVFNTAKHLVR